METRILDATDPERALVAIAAAARLLDAGELVAFPTETVYGLGASALDSATVERVFEVKGRPSSNPLIVHVGSVDDIAAIAIIDDRVRTVAQQFMPGPLTLVLRSRESIPLVARAGLPTVAVRIPDHDVALQLLSIAGPLVGPSANLSGKPSPTTAEHVMDDLAGRIAAVLDGGPCRIGIESTVLDLTSATPTILRPGQIEASEIQRVLGGLIEMQSDDARSPGTRFRHYAPAVPVRLVIANEPPVIDAGVRLVLTTPQHLARFSRSVTRLLSAENLYAQLRNADDAGFDEIIVYALPGELSPGLLDRITRAARG